jgi:hypothetical protein
VILEEGLTGGDVLLSARELDLFIRLLGGESGACRNAHRNKQKHDSHD